MRHSQHPLDAKQLAALNTEIDNIVTLPELNNLSIIYQIKAVSAPVKGKTDESYQAINTGIDLEMSSLNYVLLGKVYEMKGMNWEAADAYLTAFNLRPGANTLYWIENGIFQTSVPYVVPYLDKFRFRISNSRVDSCSEYLLLSFCMFTLVGIICCGNLFAA